MMPRVGSDCVWSAKLLNFDAIVWRCACKDGSLSWPVAILSRWGSRHSSKLGLSPLLLSSSVVCCWTCFLFPVVVFVVFCYILGCYPSAPCCCLLELTWMLPGSLLRYVLSFNNQYLYIYIEYYILIICCSCTTSTGPPGAMRFSSPRRWGLCSIHLENPLVNRS